MSGEVLNITHCVPFSETAMEDCVLALALMLPVRTPLHIEQLQFHCG